MRDVLVVYRICFVMSLFFLIHALISLCWIGIHNFCWPLKIFAYLGGLIGAFYMPMTFFDGFVQVAQFIAIIFIITQIVLFLDFAYT